MISLPLTPEREQRYARHLSLPEVGRAGQRRLLAGSVAVVGVGGLGSPAAFYLAAAGVGRIGLFDGDTVEVSNLQRQIIHATADVGTPKVLSAAAKLRALNPDVVVDTAHGFLTAATMPKALAGYDFVIDAVDNAAVKALIARTCQTLRIPCSYGGIREFSGMVMTVLPGESACLGCVFEDFGEPEPPRGPFGVLPGVIGSIQATEAVKFLAGIGTLLINRLLIYDALAMTFRSVSAAREPACPLCGETRS
ncbi:MAG: HesA/MoeB/ThiF family protein [Lentisphaeria bacterium]|nr:HesA/MoeB/ThiF family protein [Lentisphaeria bacterium]